MGGRGSGRYGGRPTSEVTQSFVLDIAELNRVGVLKKGATAVLLFTFSAAEEPFEVRVRLDLRHPVEPFAMFTHEHRSSRFESEEQVYPVFLTRTVPNFGGERWWFVCPRIGRRVQKLFLPLGGFQFLSRAGYGLGYACQRETQEDRLIRKAQKLHRSIGGNGDLSDFAPPKPKGMHRRTYERRREKMWDAEAAAEMDSLRRISRLLGRTED